MSNQFDDVLGLTNCFSHIQSGLCQVVLHPEEGMATKQWMTLRNHLLEM
jgi:hypothetical protein